jgi:hypothetical protein
VFGDLVGVSVEEAPTWYGGAEALEDGVSHGRRRKQFKRKPISAPLRRQDSAASNRAVMGAMKQVGVNPESDAREQRADSLIEGRRAVAVKHLDGFGSEPAHDLVPEGQVVDQEMRDLVGQGESTFVLWVVGVEQDGAPAAEGDQASMQASVWAGNVDRDRGLLEPAPDAVHPQLGQPLHQ